MKDQIKRIILQKNEKIEKSGTLVRKLYVPDGYDYSHMDSYSRLIFHKTVGNKNRFEQCTLCVKAQYICGRGYWVAEPWRIWDIDMLDATIEFSDKQLMVVNLTQALKYKLFKWQLPQHMPEIFHCHEIEIVGIEVVKQKVILMKYDIEAHVPKTVGERYDHYVYYKYERIGIKG